jgi:hypothetical protein
MEKFTEGLIRKLQKDIQQFSYRGGRRGQREILEALAAKAYPGGFLGTYNAYR